MTKRDIKRYNNRVAKIIDLIVKSRNAKSYGPMYWDRAYKIADLTDNLVNDYETNLDLRNHLKAISKEVEKTIDYTPLI